MADTGRTVFADGFFADGFWAVDFFAADEPVAVPDVVGETQAAGTSTLEGGGFVVAVETAYSSLVPAGSIISQVPAGGVDAAPGSTVTITVSLGEGAGGFFIVEARRRGRR
jgi:beta-lactam-binding protein with PASTA domain